MNKKSIILLAVGILLTAFLIYYMMRFQHYKIGTSGMSNTLFPGNVILIDKFANTPQVNNIAAFKSDKGKVFCSRVVGLPGDKIELTNSLLKVNNIEFSNPNVQYNYTITTSAVGLNEDTLVKAKLITSELFSVGNYNEYRVDLTDDSFTKLKNFKQIKSIYKNIHLADYSYKRSDLSIFPNDAKVKWSRDNLGPITVPQKDKQIELNISNLPLYKKIIIEYEENTLELNGDQIVINNKVVTTYTFRQNYYWFMSDNRHKAIDSRYLGFVPEINIVGTYKSTLY